MTARRFAVFALVAIAAFPMVGAGLLDSGIQAYKGGRYVEAIQILEGELMRGPSASERREIYLYLGKSYESCGRLDKAVSAYEMAAQLDRKNWRRHRDLGGLYEQTELYWKALDCTKRALKLEPKEPALYFAMGRLWRKIGIYAYAENWLLKAWAANQDPAVQQELSFVYEGQGRFLDAAKAWAMTPGEGPRLTYLAALAGDASLAAEGRKRGTSKATENLVQLLALSPKEILAGKTDNPALQALIRSQFTEGQKQ